MGTPGLDLLGDFKGRLLWRREPCSPVLVTSFSEGLCSRPSADGGRQEDLRRETPLRKDSRKTRNQKNLDYKNTLEQPDMWPGL
ncbi:hypothetical protein AOLI_G00067180 [Acnodon oligacanthus]